MYVMCGIPGSGKTQYARMLHQDLGGQEGNIWYICPDEIRFAINKDEVSQANMRLVWELAYFAIECAMRYEWTIILDATNARRQDRQTLIDFIRSRSRWYELILYYFSVPLELAKARNDERTRVVPEHVLERMFASIQTSPPEVEEGWQDIRYITD